MGLLFEYLLNFFLIVAIPSPVGMLHMYLLVIELMGGGLSMATTNSSVNYTFFNEKCDETNRVTKVWVMRLLLGLKIS